MDGYDPRTHMAHPLPEQTIDEWIRQELRDPDNWVKAFMLAVCVWVCLVAILTS